MTVLMIVHMQGTVVLVVVHSPTCILEQVLGSTTESLTQPGHQQASRSLMPTSTLRSQ